MEELKRFDKEWINEKLKWMQKGIKRKEKEGREGKRIKGNKWKIK